MLTLKFRQVHYSNENSLSICPCQHGRAKKKRIFFAGTVRPTTKILPVQQYRSQGGIVKTSSPRISTDLNGKNYF